MTTLNPADKDASIGLTNNDLTATGSATSGDRNARATVSKTSGLWGFGYTVGAYNAGGALGIGWANASASLTTYLGNDANSCCYFGDAYVGNNDPLNGFSQGAGYPTQVAGDVIITVLNITLPRVWWIRNGSPCQGDPVAGTGGVVPSFSTFFPAIAVGNRNGVAQIVTLNFGAQGLTLPAGFTTIDPRDIGAVLRRPQAPLLHNLLR